jgi:hypothetical protein
MGRQYHGPAGEVIVVKNFDPGQPEHRRYVGYGRAPIPDSRDEDLDGYVRALRSGGPLAVAAALKQVSESGRRVLRAYSERSASRAVRDRSVDQLVSALVADVVGGLDQNALEALMPMALIEDAGLRIGVDPDEFFGDAAGIVGHPGSVNLMVWLTRLPEDRVVQAMGFVAAEEARGFRYKWAD